MASAATAKDNAPRIGCTPGTRLLSMRHPGICRYDDLVLADGPSLCVQPKTVNATKQSVVTVRVV